MSACIGLADKSLFAVVVVKQVQQAVVDVFAGHRQFGRCALFGAADDDRRRHAQGCRLTDGGAFERIVQNVLHAAVPEFTAAEGCRHNGQRKNSMKNVRHFELSSIYLTLNF